VLGFCHEHALILYVYLPNEHSEEESVLTVRRSLARTSPFSLTIDSTMLVLTALSTTGIKIHRHEMMIHAKGLTTCACCSVDAARAKSQGF
jgi:hypothetical protein